ncbi:MAG: YeeE/YedE family protein [Gemmatimonadota bacterium]|nr:YeeE/YedE family protein [Gemmatimonadota bacterium]
MPDPPPARRGLAALRLSTPRQPRAFALGVVGASAAALYLAGAGPGSTLLLLIGTALGVALLATGFGFTSGYRYAILRRDVTHVQAQLLMLALATVLFAPVLAAGGGTLRPVTGAFAPSGLQVLAGAFLFGIGMQLGDGCGSGTLYGAGGGSVRNMITLIAFCAGAFGATFHLGWWATLPSLGTVSLPARLGPGLFVVAQLAFLALLAFAAGRWARRGAGPYAPAGPARRAAAWIRRHPRLATGAALLALLNFATLLAAGHPWTITWAFSLWGAKTAAALGWDPSASVFWSAGFPAAALAAPVAADTTSVMDVGILLGAFAAAAWRGRFRPSSRIGWRPLGGAVAAGLLLGYGARVAFGCNIGAFFSGVASGSLHGWLWILAALPGTWLGVRLRPAFGLPNETRGAGL